MACKDLSSPSRDWTQAHGSESPNHWTTRNFKQKSILFLYISSEQLETQNSIYVKIWNRDKIYQDMCNICTQKITEIEEGLNTLRDLQCLWIREHGIIKIKYQLSSNWFMDGRKWSRQTLWAKENFNGKILRLARISISSISLSPSASYSLRLGCSQSWATSTLQGEDSSLVTGPHWPLRRPFSFCAPPSSLALRTSFNCGSGAAVFLDFFPGHFGLQRNS